MVLPPNGVFNLGIVDYDGTGQTVPSWRYLDV